MGFFVFAIPAASVKAQPRRHRQYCLHRGTARLDAAFGLRHIEGSSYPADPTTSVRIGRVWNSGQRCCPWPSLHQAGNGGAQRRDYRRLSRCHSAKPLYGSEDEIAELISFLASEKASFVTGQLITCDGGFEVTGIGLPALRRQAE